VKPSPFAWEQNQIQVNITGCRKRQSWSKHCWST